jgi:NADPH2:quinone reductase
MHFIDYRSPGPPEVLFLNKGLRPVPKSNEVLLHVKAAGVNRPDLSQRKGDYPPPKGANPILGLEVAGIVVEKGIDVQRWQVGDSVCALTNGGGYAEFCAIPEVQCLPLPKTLNFIEAASLPETYFTVWSNVFQRGHLVKGETLLIHAGASGIGAAAIQLAKLFGAKVIATTSTVEKAAFCQSLHVDHVILYRSEDFEKKIMELTRNKGVDLILDMIGGTYFSKNLNLLKQEGRLLQIAFLQGRQVELDLAVLMQKRLTITGSTLRPQSTEAKGKIAADLLEKVWPLFAQKKIKPTVTAVFPLNQAAKAHQLLESGNVFGKIVLTPTSQKV